MERITSDVLLKGETWDYVIERLQPSIFKTQYGVYALAVAIGIMYDKQLSSDEDEKNDLQKYVPRTMLYQRKEELEILFQTAILTTELVDFSEEQRLELAFGNSKIKDFNEMQFLTRFANYGATILKEKIADEAIETMENIKNFITSTVEGTNFDLDPLSDDDIDISMEDLE